MYCGENDIMSAVRVLQLFPGQAIKYTVAAPSGSNAVPAVKSEV